MVAILDLDRKLRAIIENMDADTRNNLADIVRKKVFLRSTSHKPRY